MTEVEKIAARLADLDLTDSIQLVLATALQGVIKGLLKVRESSQGADEVKK